MPLYVYEHVEQKGADCPDRFELVHALSEEMVKCPQCGGAVKKVVARTSYKRNVLASSNLREKGFTRLRRRDKGVYERD